MCKVEIILHEQMFIWSCILCLIFSNVRQASIILTAWGWSAVWITDD